MVRSLWNCATGMNTQQLSTDTISNNLANVNTTGFKSERNNFKSLLYQNIENLKYADPDVQTGLGVRSASISKDFSQGAFISSDNPTSFALEGKGFFAVQGADGETYYTRNGNFTFSNDNGFSTLTTAEGDPVLSETGQIITLSQRVFFANRVTFDSSGTLMYPTADGGGPLRLYYVDMAGNPIMYFNLRTQQQEPLPVQIGIYQFPNRQGLEQTDGTLFKQTQESGEVINEFNNLDINPSTIYNRYLESSNVHAANEMVNMIATQRIYDANSKGILTTDDMMQKANDIKR